jgi:hypothetical protein
MSSLHCILRFLISQRGGYIYLLAENHLKKNAEILKTYSQKQNFAELPLFTHCSKKYANLARTINLLVKLYQFRCFDRIIEISKVGVVVFVLFFFFLRKQKIYWDAIK